MHFLDGSNYFRLDQQQQWKQRLYFSIINHIRRFDSPQVMHTDQAPAFHNECVGELLRLCRIEQSFATAYSKEANGIVERANQEWKRLQQAYLQLK